MREFLRSVAASNRANLSLYATTASIYVHYPYCSSLCTYCGFNKYRYSGSTPVEREELRKCLAQDVTFQLKNSLINQVSSIYFGGGTPSLAQPQLVKDVIDAVKSNASLLEDAEVTLEVNPSQEVCENLLVNYKNAGVNRISMGVQSLRDSDLSKLGRSHTSAEAVACLVSARNIFPSRVSTDFIFGRPSQSLQDLRQELLQLIPLADDHVSMYQLTVENGTPLFKSVKNKKLTLPGDVKLAKMYDTTVKTLKDAGYKQYEVSNFSATDAARSRHNMNYWMGGQYVGVGPGAHGRIINPVTLVKERTVQAPLPKNWNREVNLYGHGIKSRTPMSLSDCLEELLMAGLRTNDGVSEKSWNRILTFHCSEKKDWDDLSMPNIFRKKSSIYLDHLFENRQLVYDTNSLLIPDSCLIVSDSIITYIFNHLHTVLAT